MKLLFVSVTQLRVTDIVFNDIKTDSFRVHWTPPTDLDNYVTGYTVSVLPNSPQPSIDVGNATYADITDLTPGKKYTVIIISRHGISAKTTRTTNTDKEQLTSKLFGKSEVPFERYLVCVSLG